MKTITISVWWKSLKRNMIRSSRKPRSSKLPQRLKQTLFVDLIISKFINLILKWWNEVLARSLKAEAMRQPTISGGGRKGMVGKDQDTLLQWTMERSWTLRAKRDLCNAILGPAKPLLDSLHTSQKLGRVKLEELCCPSHNKSGSLAVSGAVCVCCLLVLPSCHIKTGFSAPFPQKETTCLHRDLSWETKIQPLLPSA